MMLRQVTNKDYQAIEQLTIAAFNDVYRPGCVEHVVIDNIRKHERYLPSLEYVITEDNQLVAHIIYIEALVEQVDGNLMTCVMFGPVSVKKEEQNKGYGTALIKATLGLAQAKGYPYMLITGNPTYYHRFGFIPAMHFGIRYPGIADDQDHSFFMIKVLDESKMTGIAGQLLEPEPYRVNDEEVQSYNAAHHIKPLSMKETDK